MEISFHDGDNFIRNTVTVRCGGVAFRNILARKVTVSDEDPVPIDDLMLDLRVDSDDEEETVRRMARGAAAFMERRTAYVLLPGTYEVTLPGWWVGDLELNRGPLRSVDSVRYLAGRDDWQDTDLDGFYVDAKERSFNVRALTSFNRPTLWSEVGQVRLTFQAGFRVESESEGEAPELEDGLRTTLTMLVAHYYKNRELFAAGALEAVEKGAEGILGAYRQYW